MSRRLNPNARPFVPLDSYPGCLDPNRSTPATPPTTSTTHSHVTHPCETLGDAFALISRTLNERKTAHNKSNNGTRNNTALSHAHNHYYCNIDFNKLIKLI